MNVKDKYNAESYTNLQKGIAIGYVFARTEETISAVRDSSGSQFTESDLAKGLVQLILAKYQAGREVLHGPERLSSLWQDTSQGHEVSSPEETLHVHARKPGTRKPLTEAKIRRVIRLRNEGKTYSQISQLTGLANFTLWRVLKGLYGDEQKKRKEFEKLGHTPLPPEKKRKEYVRKKKHWTQLPENRERVAKQLKRMQRAYRAKLAA